MAIGSAAGAAVGSAGIAVAVGSSIGGDVGSAVGAAVAGEPHAASTRLARTNTNSIKRTVLVISKFSFLFLQRCDDNNGLLMTMEE
jgi:phage tail tape-measure protein